MKSDLAEARAEAATVANAMGELRRVVPEPAAYVSESNFFEKDWQRALLGFELRAAAGRSSANTTRTACSLSITGSAARSGAATGLKGVPRISLVSARVE